MRTLRPSFAILALALCASSCTLQSAGRQMNEIYDVNTSLLAGWRSIDHPQFDSHAVLGIEFDVKPKEENLGLEVGISAADESVSDGGIRREADFYEGYAGLRWHFPQASERFLPYVSLGANYFKADRVSTVGATVTSAEDWSGGVYARAGLHGPIGSFGLDGGTEILAGADVRAVFGDDYDWVQLTFMLGFTRP